MKDFPYGFRIVGATRERRRLVDAAAAFRAYAECDPRAECDKEGYLSAFRFGEDFRLLLTETGSTAGFTGACWSPVVWFDLDSEELHYAHNDAAALVAMLSERYAVAETELPVFFSGSKGFHIGVPTAMWRPEPSGMFNKVCRRFAENVAELAAVTIDTGVYDAVRTFRAPNSRHPKTGLHKRWLPADVLSGRLDGILELAREPAPFKMPSPAGTSEQAAVDWQAAVDQACGESEAKAQRLAAGNGEASLNRQTLEFIHDGAIEGDRHRLLFSAAANLAEFRCPSVLAHALLDEAGLDCGLTPKDVRRQIKCGLASIGSASTPQDAPDSPQDGENGSVVQEPEERDTGDSEAPEGQSCQQVTGATTPTKAALAAMWKRAETGRAVLPPSPPPFVPLPPRAVGTGKLETPCRCGSTEFADVAISEGRTGRDCRKCGRFLDWGKWHEEGDAGQ